MAIDKEALNAFLRTRLGEPSSDEEKLRRIGIWDGIHGDLEHVSATFNTATDGDGEVVLVGVGEGRVYVTRVVDANSSLDGDRDRVHFADFGSLQGAIVGRRRVVEANTEPIEAIAITHKRLPGGHLEIRFRPDEESEAHEAFAQFRTLAG